MLVRAEEVVQIAVVVGLLVLAAVILVRTFVDFLGHPGRYPGSVGHAIDGVLAVIILLDVVRTVLAYFEGSDFPIRPFLSIGILAAVREILSATFYLAVGGGLSRTDLQHYLVQLAAGVAVALALLIGLLILRYAHGDPGT